MSDFLSGRSHQLYRLEPVSESRELPPGRYVLFGDAGAEIELHLQRKAHPGSIASAIRDVLGPKPIKGVR